MAQYINFNGNIIREDQPIYTAASRAARFGDGIFETMRVRNGKILFEQLHRDRLLNGLQLLQLPSHFTWHFLRSAIDGLLEKNGHHLHARVRLMITRGDGGIMEQPTNAPQVLAETWNANDYSFNESGLKMDVFQDIPRSRTPFSNIKTCNYLSSVMAVMFAKEKQLDECFLINEDKRICDATISNVFWIREEKIFTTPLSEGGIDGVMRKHVMTILSNNGMAVTESALTIDELKKADEVYLTNVMRGVHWVKEFGEKSYAGTFALRIFQLLTSSIS